MNLVIALFDVIMVNSRTFMYKYLQIFLPVEHDRLGLDFAIFDVTLVANQHNRDIFTDAYKISVPIWHVLVCNASSYVEHDDSTLT